MNSIQFSSVFQRINYIQVVDLHPVFFKYPDRLRQIVVAKWGYIEMKLSSFDASLRLTLNLHHSADEEQLHLPNPDTPWLN